VVAVKALGFEGRAPSALAEFEAEIETLRRLASCPNVVTLLDEGAFTVELQARGGRTFPVHVPFMVIDRAVTGFHRMLKHRDEVPWAFRLTIFRDIVEGVSQMHRAGLVHGDVKATNCLVFEDEPKGRITDVGAANGRTGDPVFAPPERFWELDETGSQGARLTELYLLGSLLYECATGKGITAAVLGPLESAAGRSAGVADREARERDFRSSLPLLRGQYEAAYEVFEREAPTCIATEGAALLRRLTDPDPRQRGPSVPASDDLAWLIERVEQGSGAPGRA
jgi:serine/threonine protein kinase